MSSWVTKTTTPEIPRVCRWDGDVEQADNPDWRAVVELFRDHRDHLKIELRRFGQLVQRLPNIMHECDVDDDVIEHRLRIIDDHARQLLNL